MSYNNEWQSRVAPERAVMSTALTVHNMDKHKDKCCMTSTYVYFICVGSGPIKIGISDDPQQRLATFQTAHYRKLHLLYTLECLTRDEAFQLETAFHRWYADVQLLNEWFEITPSQIEADIQLFETLAKSVVRYACHTSSETIAKIERRALIRKSNSTPPTGEIASIPTERTSAGEYTKRCPICGFVTVGTTPRQATNKMVAHQKRHANEAKRSAIALAEFSAEKANE